MSAVLFDSPPSAIPVFLWPSRSEEESSAAGSLRPSSPDSTVGSGTSNTDGTLGSMNETEGSMGLCNDEWITRSASMSQTSSLSFNSRLDLNAAFPEAVDDAKRARLAAARYRKNRRGWLPNEETAATAGDASNLLVTPPRPAAEHHRRRVILTPVERMPTVPIARKIEDLRVWLPLGSPDCQRVTPSISGCSPGSSTIHRSDGVRLAEGTPAPVNLSGWHPGLDTGSDSQRSGTDALSSGVSGQTSVTRSSGCGSSMGRNPSSRNVSSAGMFFSDSEYSSYQADYTTPSMSPTVISAKTVSDFTSSEIRRLQRRRMKKPMSGISPFNSANMYPGNRPLLDHNDISETLSDAFISACASSSGSDDMSSAMLDEMFGEQRNLFGSVIMNDSKIMNSLSLNDNTLDKGTLPLSGGCGSFPFSSQDDCESPAILERSRRLVSEGNHPHSGVGGTVRRQLTKEGSPCSTPVSDELICRHRIRRVMPNVAPQSWFEANQVRADLASQNVIRLPLSRTGNLNGPLMSSSSANVAVGSLGMCPSPASMMTLSSCSTYDRSPVREVANDEAVASDLSFATLRRRLVFGDDDDVSVAEDEHAVPHLGLAPGDGFEDLMQASDAESDNGDECDLTESIQSLRF